jgi:hypothetical protein
VQISREEANQALREIDRTTERVSELRCYRRAAPHLVVWGLVLLAANLATAWRPAAADRTWMILTLAGIAASVIIGAVGQWRARNMDLTLRQRLMWRRFLLTFCAFIGYEVLSTLLFRGQSTVHAFNAQMYLLVALGYVLMGTWSGSRIAWLGVLLAGATMFGVLVVPGYFALWMGLIGGGMIFGTGLWLRTA